MDEHPHLSRFNVHQLRQIEQALAQHLRLNIEQVDEAGFTVVPGAGPLLRVTWQGSAPITIDDFQSIVDEATEEVTSTGPQPRPGGHEPPPRVTRRVPRRRSAKADEAV